MSKILLALFVIVFLSLPLQTNADAVLADAMNPKVLLGASDTGQMKPKERQEVTVSDPLEVWNRVIFTFNDLFYHGILKPVSQVYAFLLPEPIRLAVNHFFHNLAMPKHFVSALLQGKMDAAGRELGRFGINTTLGGLGFFDVADTHFDLKSSDEDIGQTLGTYGIGDAIYLQWPILGPSNLRDTFGQAGDILLNPMSYYPENFWTRAEIASGRLVNHTSLHIGEYEDLKKAAIDPYIALRDAYVQMRRDQIKR